MSDKSDAPASPTAENKRREAILDIVKILDDYTDGDDKMSESVVRVADLIEAAARFKLVGATIVVTVRPCTRHDGFRSV